MTWMSGLGLGSALFPGVLWAKVAAGAELTAETIAAPPGLPDTAGAFVKISIKANDEAHPAWARPVDVYFRRQAAGWQLVGVDRLP